MIDNKIKEERVRLGLSQKEVVEFTQVAQNTQYNYEIGRREPDRLYLRKIEELGFDIFYIVTGKRNASNISDDESLILNLLRKATAQQKLDAITLLMGKEINSVRIKGNNNQVAGNNILK